MVLYIGIEGPDGSGKTTLANYLNDHKAEISSHLEVISHRSFEASSSRRARFFGNITSSIAKYGECHGIEGIANLGYALCELPYIFAKGKAEAKGIVLSDRIFSISADIFINAEHPNYRFILPLIRQLKDSPDNIIYLKIDSDTAYERVKQKSICQKHETRDTLEKLVSGYDSAMASLSQSSKVEVFTIDASKNIEVVADEAMSYVKGVIASYEKIFHEEYSFYLEDKTGKADTDTRSLLKKRLFSWYQKEKIDAFEGAEVLRILNKKEISYVLENIALFLVTEIPILPGISSFIFCPARFLYTIVNRIYWNKHDDKEKAKIHSLDVALISAIPLIGAFAHFLSLYRIGIRNSDMYKLILEESPEIIKIKKDELKKKIKLKLKKT